MAVEAKELANLLLHPLRLVKNTLDDIDAVDASAADLRLKATSIGVVLQRLGSWTYDRNKWLSLVTDEQQQNLLCMLKEARVRLETAKKLQAKRPSRSSLKMWFRARHLKSSFVQAQYDLDGVIAVLTMFQTSLCGDRLDHVASSTERMQKQLAELQQFGRECSFVDLSTDSEDEGKKMTPEGSSSRTFAATQLETSLRYNRRKLEFLQKQMAPLRNLDNVPPPGSVMDDWESSWAVLDNTLDIAATLIERHESQFNLHTFYSGEHCQKKVEMICKILKAFVDDWGNRVPALRGVHVEVTIPPAAIAEDKEDLRKKLKYILKGKSCDFPPPLKAEWQDVRRRHESRVNTIDRIIIIIKKKRIKYKKQVSDDIWEAEYFGSKVTVKKVMDGNDDLELENFAKFFNEVVIMGSLRIRFVANLVGASKSGLLVVERGDRNLMEWYKDQPKPIPWRLKLSVLLQAAQGLEYVHDHEVIHRFVNSRNFLMFGTDSVKIADFSSATTISEVRSISTRRHGRLSPWIAPEIFDGSPHSLSSDVFSFGVVMHEVAAERQPYGLNATEAEVWKRKKAGDPPCRVPDDCPQGLTELMMQCCAVDPAKRPSMPDVVKQLEHLHEMGC